MKQGGSWLRCDVNIDRMSAISDTVYRQYYFLCSHFVIEVSRYICSNDVTPLPMQNYNIPQKALIIHLLQIQDFIHIYIIYIFPLFTQHIDDSWCSPLRTVVNLQSKG